MRISTGGERTPFSFLVAPLTQSSFRTKRYLGRDPEEVRRTGIIYVLEHPPYLAESQRTDASTSSMVSESTFEVSQKQLVKSSGWIEELRTSLRALFKRFRTF